MARPWRLRHKLVFGLALVLASIGLLVVGGLLALQSYSDASRKTVNRLNLIKLTAILQKDVGEIAETANPGIGLDAQRTQLLGQLAGVRQVIRVYRDMRGDMLLLDPSDPEDGNGDLIILDQIERHVTAVESAARPQTRVNAQSRLIDEPDVRKPYGELKEKTTNLFVKLPDYIERSIERAKKDERRGLALVFTSATVAVVLVLTLLYYFKVWVFDPIRALQHGVQQVREGNFDYRIVLHTDDEFGELAGQFNALVQRVGGEKEDLARQVNERSRQLVRSERMVSVGFLAAGVAHEINNPLASIAFCSEALERRMTDQFARLAKEDGEVLAKYLKVIQTEAFRCKQITQKLLDFSRTGERKREPTDLGRLVQDVIDVARLLPNHRAKQIAFSPVYLVAGVSPPDLKSVVLNLIVNALDSMDDGGVLTVAVAQGGPPGREFAELTFRDTGCGMPGEVLENIFEPFFTRRRTGNGTGLGLSISHQIIDQHGGTITASSAGPGKGSTFVVRVPLRAAEAQAKAA